VVLTDTVTAEFIKYAINTFYATKVLFANALYDVAENLGIEYDTVRDAMYARKWIGGNHLTVPWKGKRGINGKCLPKDLAAFATFSGHEFFEFMVSEAQRAD
jgi:UDP-glucose 6-dehydrogenase